MVYKMTDKQVLGKLKTKYGYDVAWELYYLYGYLLSENRENEFDKIVEIIKDKTNIRIVTDGLKELEIILSDFKCNKNCPYCTAK